MRFYTKQHEHYCGIDLHTKKMYVCILNNEGEICLHENIPTQPHRFLRLIAPYREDVIVGVECIFSWYWLADLCAEEGIPFILGHAFFHIFWNPSAGGINKKYESIKALGGKAAV